MEVLKLFATLNTSDLRSRPIGFDLHRITEKFTSGQNVHTLYEHVFYVLLSASDHSIKMTLYQFVLIVKNLIFFIFSWQSGVWENMGRK